MFQILNYQFILKQKKGGEILRRKNLIKLRVDLGLKSKEMAKKLGISPTKYSNIENGKVEPSIDLLYKFQELFGIDNVLDLVEKEA